MRPSLALLALILSLPAAPAAAVEVDPRIEHALGRLYSFDFEEAHVILDGYISNRPGDPLGHVFRGAAFLFSELDRLKILESEFFKDDARIADKAGLRPDPEVRRRLMQTLERTEELAQARLAADPEDAEALFALCLKEGLHTDYVGLVEKRKLMSLSSARQADRHARRLLAIEPDYYDAHLSGGINEYLIGSLPFFIRWFVRFEGVEGSKERAFERLELVAERGRYLGPFARILLSIMSLREKRPERARELLVGLSHEYPENPLFRKELLKISDKLARGELATAR